MSPSNTVHIPSTVSILMIFDPLVVSSSSSVSSPPPFHVYSHRHRSKKKPSDSTQVSTTLSHPASTTEFNLHPIVLRKGICSTCNPSPHYIALSYHRLSSPFYTYLSSISFVTIPKSVSDVLGHPSWRQVMLDELQ